MSRNVVTLDVEQDLALAEEILKLAHCRHLPVVQEGRLVGLVTHRDLLRVLAETTASFSTEENEWFGRQRVKRTIRAGDVMTQGVTTVSPDTPLTTAVELMRQNNFGCLPVVERGDLVGILTEWDLVDWAGKALEEKRASSPAGDPSPAI
ncbi:MAG: CBS domain-containing protein [Deltaproteobacteria bacterium]|nr:CBS domain-containing protein [Deltaproteobacteria bacterium]